jgi:Ca-activated chloride channel family protein
MKEHFEKHQDRLSSAERDSAWDAIRNGTTARGKGRLPQWRPLWLYAPAATAAVIAVVVFLRFGADGPRLSSFAERMMKQAPTRVEQRTPVRPEQTPVEPRDAMTLEAQEPSTHEAPAAGGERQAADSSPAAAPMPARGLMTDESGGAAERATAQEKSAPPPEPPSSLAASADAETQHRVEVRGKPGETGTITGIVRDVRTGDPLPYVHVALSVPRWGCMTDDTGRFTFPHVPVGTYDLRVAFVGYEELLLRDVHVTPESPVDLAISLGETVAAGPNEIVVLGEKQLLQNESSTTRHMVEQKTVESTPADNLKEAVAARAGVVAKAGELHFRGGRSGEVLYQVDGVPVRDPVSGKRRAPDEEPPVYPSTGGTTEPNDKPYDAMFFQHYGVNPFISTEDDALSTFALDVDAASYTIARRYIELGHLPDPGEPRVEEFVNFFNQDYAEVEDDFGIFLDGAPSRFGSGYHLLRIGIKARSIAAHERPCANLVFVIDVSGSMAREDRLELVKRALGLLVEELRSDDRVGIVVYGSQGRVLLPPSTIRDDRRILDAIAGLSPEGSTNAEDGLMLGYEMARRIYRDGEINRIILCSDGVANVGRTGPESILEHVRGEADRGIYLTAVGFGMGNFNDVLMEQLANKGDGNYYYVDGLDEARRVFVENLTGTLQTVARDAKVQVEFNPARVDRYRLLGFENRDIADRDFRNDAVDAGEIGAGHEVTALYEVKIAGRTRSGPIATVRLRHTPAGREEEGPRQAREISRTFDARDLARSFEAASPRFRLDATAAEFAEILRHSYWAKDSSIEDLLPIARGLERELRNDPAVGEFADMVDRAAGLSDRLSPEERGRRDGDDGLPAGLDRPFTLGPGEWARVGAVTIAFERVLVDDRRPPDVRRYWEGEARVAMWTDDGDGRRTFVLSTYRPKTARIPGYEIELLGVWPPPRGATRPIDNTEALIELVVRRQR